jgi:hypothetical protein
LTTISKDALLVTFINVFSVDQAMRDNPGPARRF